MKVEIIKQKGEKVSEIQTIGHRVFIFVDTLDGGVWRAELSNNCEIIIKTEHHEG